MRDKPHTLKFVRLSVPGGRGINATLTRFARPDGPLFWVRPDRWLAWWIRRLADRIDGATSYTWHGTLPADCTADDWQDAVEYGAAATIRYLADLLEERRHGFEED